jgi:hypothetical protein
MRVIKVGQGQNLFDVALQYCGAAEAIVEIAILNEIGVTDDINMLNLKVPDYFNRKNAEYFSNNNFIPATNCSNESLTNTGIDYMEIENDFIVI